MDQTQPTRVLLAEDNSGDVRLIRIALSEAGDWPITYSLARDGAEAIFLLERSQLDPDVPPPDLVILDYNLPKHSGAEVLKRIRHSEQLHKLPVIVLSSSPEDFLRARMQDARVEANCYFTKPPDLDEFVELGKRIRRCYEAGRAA